MSGNTDRIGALRARGDLVYRLVFASIISLAGLASAHAEGKVHADPATPCSQGGFKPHELCFELPSDGVARAEVLSETFYTVILKTTERCVITEDERLRVQALFPGSKVFSMRFNCDDDVEENVSYTNVNDKFGFLAVYAGRTLKEAKARLEQVKAAGRFPGANIRKMQAMFVYP
jgi:hypothetical protein